MHFFEFVLCVVGLMVGARMFASWMDYRAQRSRYVDAQPGPEQGELEALRERVAILEEIVTEPRYQLSDAIDALEPSATRGATTPQTQRRH